MSDREGTHKHVLDIASATNGSWESGQQCRRLHPEVQHGSDTTYTALRNPHHTVGTITRNLCDSDTRPTELQQNLNHFNALSF
jgi:hypothetical protein